MQKKSMVKISLLTLIVAFMAFGTIAIAKTVITNETPANKTVTTEPWYFQGGDPELPASYSKTPLTGKPCGAARQTICEIEAPENEVNPGHPNLNASVQGDGPENETVLDQIIEAMGSLSSGGTTNETVKSFRAL